MAIDEQGVSTGTYVRGMERLVQAVQELSMARDLPQVQQIVRTTARELAGSDGATFVLRDAGQCYYADEDAIEPLWKGSRFPMETCISGWTMINRQTVTIEDIYADDRIPHAAYRPTFVKSLVMVPIRSLDPIGAIGNYWADGHVASGDEIRLLQALADATSVAMENISVHDELERRVVDRTADLEQANADIRTLSATDSLTGLLNRRGFFDAAEVLLTGARHTGSTCLVAFVDVDGLKTVNDDLGHVAGDEVLVQVAAALRTVTRPHDVVARLGGDEFCVLVVDPPVDQRSLRDRLVARLDAVNLGRDGHQPLSASVGTASTSDLPDASIDDLVLAADQRMYEHKRSRHDS
ncbi:GGDEF domain-containing protein [Aeromicrobium fastidiosum]|nr:sensor domain-containing diguanylate cyclase [Aeromicrobium fastidiosum]MBP2388876.1 diguanylate cyclase (GGDEF)-like protein [Aeromicrobium fastidiosum]